VLISFEDGASLAVTMDEESNSKQPNPNTVPVPKTVGVTMARGGGWWTCRINAGNRRNRSSADSRRKDHRPSNRTQKQKVES